MVIKFNEIIIMILVHCMGPNLVLYISYSLLGKILPHVNSYVFLHMFSSCSMHFEALFYEPNNKLKWYYCIFVNSVTKFLINNVREIKFKLLFDISNKKYDAFRAWFVLVDIDDMS